MRWLVSAVAFAAALVGFVSHAGAQPPPRHQGFNWGVGVGQAKLTGSCSPCLARTEQRGNNATFHFGWTLIDKVIATANGAVYQRDWLDSEGDPLHSSYVLGSIGAQFYPTRRSDVFVKGAFGIARMSAPFGLLRSRQQVKATSPVIQFGVGSDLRLGRTWSLTPFVDWVIGFAGDGDPEVERDGPIRVKTNALLFGLALVWP